MPVVKPQPGDLEAIEKASRDEISALQLQRLQATLQHVYDKVPHYRNAFDAKGVHPSDLKQLSDLSKFPFTVKKDLRDNYHQAPPVNPRWWGTPSATSTTGPIWWPGRSAPPAGAGVTWCTSLTDTGFSPVVWVRITVPSVRVVR